MGGRGSRDREIAGGLAEGDFRHAFDGTGYQPLRGPAQHDAQQEADAKGGKHDLPYVGLDPLELLKRQRDAHDAPHALGLEGYRHVSHVGFEGVAVSDAVADARRDGLDDFGPGAVVFHERNAGEGDG